MSDHTRSGLPENIAALLSYVLGWVTGLVFLLIDKRPYVRLPRGTVRSCLPRLTRFAWRARPDFWHGLVVWRGRLWGAFTLGALLVNLFSLLSLVLWIVLMVKAFQGVRFKLPVAGEIAESLAGRTG